MKPKMEKTKYLSIKISKKTYNFDSIYSATINKNSLPDVSPMWCGEQLPQCGTAAAITLKQEYKTCFDTKFLNINNLNDV